MGYNERWRLNARDWEEMSKDELQEQIAYELQSEMRNFHHL